MQYQNKPSISVLLVVYNESKHIERALMSVLNQSLATDKIQLIIVDGESSDDTLSLCERFKNQQQSKFYSIEILSNSNKTLATGWNMGIEASKSDYVIRFDGHSTLSSDYLKIAVTEIGQSSNNVAGIGGWMEHKSNTFFGTLACLFYSSRFGGGSADFRRRPSKAIVGDTALFAVYKKRYLYEVGLLNEYLKRNQDIDLHKKMRALGFIFITSPKLRIDYYVRSSVFQLLKKAYQDGFWVGASKGYYLRHLVPLFFLIYLVFLLAIFIFFKNFAIQIVSVVPLIVYFTGVIGSLTCTNAGALNIAMSVPIFLAYHIIYGFGSFLGFLRRLARRDKIR
ncbi:glycosyltransferase [Pseudidiomarina sp. E22-M8]|uniref:glycosyltransferase n=1 Tax=Pseudidiomarina sp. E22-M8 TaxID=3424768 RepID=UPI00403CB1E6